jgi:hypothetical protein
VWPDEVKITYTDKTGASATDVTALVDGSDDAEIAIIELRASFTNTGAGYGSALIEVQENGATWTYPPRAIAGNITLNDISYDSSVVFIPLDANLKFEYKTTAGGGGGSPAYEIIQLGYLKRLA